MIEEEAANKRLEYAYRTRYPDHHRLARSGTVFELAGGDTTGWGITRQSAIIRPCPADYPDTIDEIGDGGLATGCLGCDQQFVWVDRTQAWGAT